MSRPTASKRLMSDAEIYGKSQGIFKPQGMCRKPLRDNLSLKADSLVKGWDLGENA